MTPSDRCTGPLAKQRRHQVDGEHRHPRAGAATNQKNCLAAIVEALPCARKDLLDDELLVEQVVLASARDHSTIVDLVKNTYRVLLSRALKGCYVHFMDRDTERFVRSRMATRVQ